MALHSAFLDILKQRDFPMAHKFGGNLLSHVEGNVATLSVYMDGKRYSLDELKSLEKYWSDFIETQEESYEAAAIWVNGGVAQAVTTTRTEVQRD